MGVYIGMWVGVVYYYYVLWFVLWMYVGYCYCYGVVEVLVGL